MKRCCLGWCPLPLALTHQLMCWTPPSRSCLSCTKRWMAFFRSKTLAFCTTTTAVRRGRENGDRDCTVHRQASHGRYGGGKEEENHPHWGCPLHMPRRDSRIGGPSGASALRTRTVIACPYSSATCELISSGVTWEKKGGKID